jgi:hypothetical protein
LNHATSINLDGQVNHFALHLLCQDFLLKLASVFEKLLYHVVAKDVLHQLEGIGFNLSEDLLLLIAISGLQLLLDESRAVLVPAELDGVVIDVSELVSLVRLVAVYAELIEQSAAHALAGILISRRPDWSHGVEGVSGDRRDGIIG